MDELETDVNAELKACREQHSRDTFEIEKLKAEIAVLKPELAALRYSGGDGGKLHADYRQLKQVFHAHLRWAGACEDPSNLLLLFYAIECGLKCIYLRRTDLKSTKQLADNGLLSRNGHDIVKWCKALSLPANLAKTTVHFRLVRDASVQYNIDKAHEAWRYGVVIEPGPQATIVAWLLALSVWIKEQPETR